MLNFHPLQAILITSRGRNNTRQASLLLLLRALLPPLTQQRRTWFRNPMMKMMAIPYIRRRHSNNPNTNHQLTLAILPTKYTNLMIHRTTVS